MGDIGISYLSSYDNFLDECSETYENTLVITENHEYYQFKNKDKWTMDKTNEEIEKIVQKFENVHFLNNKHYQLKNDHIVLGTTLWSYIPQESYSEAIQMNDYRLIYKSSGENITREYANAQHNKNIKWLEENIKKYEAKKIIIMSHHLPSYKMISRKFAESAANCCFASNLEH